MFSGRNKKNDDEFGFNDVSKSKKNNFLDMHASNLELCSAKPKPCNSKPRSEPTLLSTSFGKSFLPAFSQRSKFAKL